MIDPSPLPPSPATPHDQAAWPAAGDGSLRAILESPWTALAGVTIVRALVFPFAWNLYGDAPARVETVLQWIRQPCFLRSFEGARQFGPLNVYLLAGLYWLVPDKYVVPRLLSLALGSLSAWPLYRLSEARFGRRAAAISGGALALYGLHIQSCTTATSEAIFLFFLLWALVSLDRACNNPRWLVVAAVAMGCACATRYDGWLYAPLTWLWLARPVRSGRLGWRRAFAYAAATLAIPAFLMWGNWRDLGDPFYLIHYINADHLQNAARASAAMGRLRYAAYCAAFWPTNLAIELSPVTAVAIALAVAESSRKGRGRDLWLLAAVPALVFSVEGALLRFHPLARFTLPTALLLLPYAGRGAELLLTERSAGARRVIWLVAAFFAIAFPVYFSWRTEGRSDPWADALRPISPVSNLPPDLAAAAAALTRLAPDRTVLVDSDAAYDDLPLAFYLRLPAARILQLRHQHDRESLRRGPAPDLLAILKGGELIASGLGTPTGGDLLAFGRRYRQLEQFGRVEIFVVK